MEPQRLLDELVGVARKLGVEVRTQALRVSVHHSNGGMCKLRGKPVVLLDSKSAPLERLVTLAEALAPLAQESEAVYMAPEARELLDAARARREGRARPSQYPAMRVHSLTRAKPGVRAARRPPASGG